MPRRDRDEEALREITSALAGSLARIDEPGLDHLCCGRSGRIELAVAASNELGRPDLLARARSAALESLSRAQAGRAFALPPPCPPSRSSPDCSVVSPASGTPSCGSSIPRASPPSSSPHDGGLAMTRLPEDLFSRRSAVVSSFEALHRAGFADVAGALARRAVEEGLWPTELQRRGSIRACAPGRGRRPRSSRPAGCSRQRRARSVRSSSHSRRGLPRVS